MSGALDALSVGSVITGGYLGLIAWKVGDDTWRVSPGDEEMSGESALETITKRGRFTVLDRGDEV